MKLNTVSSVTREFSEIDLRVIEDILNAMRTKSWLSEKLKIPQITIRWWTFREVVLSILSREHIPIGTTDANLETGLIEINIIVPPIWNIKRNTEINQILYIIAHELAHAFSVGLKYNQNHAGLNAMNEWLTEIVAIKIFYEYNRQKWIQGDISWFGYTEEMQRISDLMDYLESRWYGDQELILESLVQGYMSGIDLLETLNELLSSWVDHNDVWTILTAIWKVTKNPS